MGGFETSIVVRRPLEEVAAYLSDLQNDPQWRREWADAEPLSAGPLGVGTTTALLGEFWGRRIKAVYEVARYEPHRLTEWRTVSGPLSLTFRRGFQEAGAGTRVTFSYDAQPSAVLKLVEPLVIRLGRRQLDGDVPVLRVVLEGRTASPAEAAGGPDPLTRAGIRRSRRVEARVWIDRPAQDVFAYVTSLDQWPEWRRDVVGGRVLPEGDLRVGSRAQAIAKVLGRTVTIDVVVTALEPGVAFGYRPVNGPLLTDNLYHSRARTGAAGHPHRRHQAPGHCPGAATGDARAGGDRLPQEPRRAEGGPGGAVPSARRGRLAQRRHRRGTSAHRGT